MKSSYLREGFSPGCLLSFDFILRSSLAHFFLSSALQQDTTRERVNIKRLDLICRITYSFVKGAKESAMSRGLAAIC